MKVNYGYLLLLAMALLLLVPTAYAGDGGAFSSLEAEGFTEIENGVYQRVSPDGTVETVGVGIAGLAYELARMELELKRLQGLAAGDPKDELLDAVSALETQVLVLEERLRQAAGQEGFLGPEQQLAELASLGCNLTVTRDAFALVNSSGPRASATASFSDTCATLGEVRATAYTDGLSSGARRISAESDPASGFRRRTGSASASAFASVRATLDCHTNAFAHVRIRDSFGNWTDFVRSASTTRCTFEPPVFPPRTGQCPPGEPCTIEP